MKSISVDTATQALTIALAERPTDQTNWQVKETSLIDDSRQHGETLVDQVAQILNKAEWQPDDIDQVIVGIGPGSYTGLRMSLTMAKVWAVAKQIPLFTISSLALMVPEPENDHTLYVPLIDARRGTVYTSAYQQKDGHLQPLIDDQQIDWAQMIDQVAQTVAASQSTDQPITQIRCIGKNIDSFIETVMESGLSTKVPITHQTSYPLAEHAYLPTHQSLLTHITDPDVLAPNYIHKTLAEREWEAGQTENAKKEEQNDDYIDHYSAMDQSVQRND